MKTQNGFTLYTADELSNDDYHGEKYKDYMSGSDLSVVYERSPASLQFGENKESPALKFGIAAHTMILENSKFADEVITDLDIADYPTALRGVTAQKAHLKAVGMVGYTKLKTQPEVIDAIKSLEDGSIIWEEFYEAFLDENKGKVIVIKEHIADMESMRFQIMANKENKSIIDSGIAECSLVGELDIEGEKFLIKVRPDLMSNNLTRQWDYKTTICAESEAFGKQAFNRLYWMKEALKHDAIAQFTGAAPEEVVLLAQEKTMPFLCKAYRLTQDQIAYGREQYLSAARKLKHCRENNSYYGYGSQIEDLFSPSWSGV